jgi:hypothetical protein
VLNLDLRELPPRKNNNQTNNAAPPIKIYGCPFTQSTKPVSEVGIDVLLVITAGACGLAVVSTGFTIVPSGNGKLPCVSVGQTHCEPFHTGVP